MDKAIDPNRAEHVLFTAYGLEEFTIGQLSTRSGELHAIVRKLVEKKVAAGEMIQVTKGKYKWAPDE